MIKLKLNVERYHLCYSKEGSFHDDTKKPVALQIELIALLWFAFFFNQADRQSYNVVLPLLTKDLGLSSVQTGLIGSIFLWCYALLVPLGGYLGDISRRKWVLFFSLLLASGCTFLSGIAGGMTSLILIRGFGNGGGEHATPPQSLIGQYHHQDRARRVHQTALLRPDLQRPDCRMDGRAFGWRTPFFLFGTMALILCFIILWRVKDVGQPSQTDDRKKVSRIPLKELFHGVLCKPTFWALCLSFSAFFFVICGFNTWISTFLYEKYELKLAKVGFSSMFYHQVAAATGVLLGGRISDLLAVRFPRVRIKVVVFGLFLAAPFVYLMGATSTLWVCYAALAGFGIFRGIFDSNIYATLFDVIEPKYRGSATGLMLTCIFFVGAFAPGHPERAKQTVG